MTLRLYAAVPLSKTLTECPDSIDLEIELLLKEEFSALGVPIEERGRQFDKGIAMMRACGPRTW